MAYKITLDFINRGTDHPSEVGKGRYRKAQRDEEGKIMYDASGNPFFDRVLSDDEMPHKFRLKDDDGEVYFHGISNDSSSFQPLDVHGASYGCTTIEYQNAAGEWEIL